MLFRTDPRPDSEDNAAQGTLVQSGKLIGKNWKAVCGPEANLKPTRQILKMAASFVRDVNGLL
jgi:hypothetical protein